MASHRRNGRVILDRRLNGWQIFFIAIGGVIGIGFFRGSSKSLAISGPVGALIAVAVVGVVATAVMEGIAEMIIRWPIPNAMVEFVKSFVDEDLGVAIGIMYWYTYCVTFSALIIAAGDLTAYWGLNWIYKAIIYAFAPIVLLAINALPVNIFGWIEFFGGIAKVCVVLGTIGLMCAINAGVGPNGSIGSKYVEDGIQNNPNVASSHFIAVSEAIPLATFAYIGVELLTTTAFEARDPSEMKLPARNIGWFSTILYIVATGTFVANTSWQDQNLPQLFQQALVTIANPSPPDLAVFALPQNPETNAAPLIALIRSGFGSRFLPAFLNGCFIYSALSCANTALFVASRQLYGLTQSINLEPDSFILVRLIAWPGGVEPRTQSPWRAAAVSAFLLYWLPFIRLHTFDDQKEAFLQDVQDSLTIIGSVSCVLMWFFQCIAYLSFSRWRRRHERHLRNDEDFGDIYNPDSTGWFFGFQPGLAWLGAGGTLTIVFFFNTIAMLNGERLSVKAISSFVSPGVVLILWLLKKISRPSIQRRWTPLFLALKDPDDFKANLRRLNDLIYPGTGGARRLGSYEMLSQRAMAPKTSEQAGSSGVDTDSRTSNVRVPAQQAYRRGDLRPPGHEPVQRLSNATAYDSDDSALPPPATATATAPVNHSTTNIRTMEEDTGAGSAYGRSHLRVPGTGNPQNNILHEASGATSFRPARSATAATMSEDGGAPLTWTTASLAGP